MTILIVEEKVPRNEALPQIAGEREKIDTATFSRKCGYEIGSFHR